MILNTVEYPARLTKNRNDWNVARDKELDAVEGVQVEDAKVELTLQGHINAVPHGPHHTISSGYCSTLLATTKPLYTQMEGVFSKISRYVRPGPRTVPGTYHRT